MPTVRFTIRPGQSPKPVRRTAEASLARSVTTEPDAGGRGGIGRIRPHPEPTDIRAAAPRRGATSYGPLLRVHGGTATRRVRVSQENGSPKAARRPLRAQRAARALGLWGLGDDAG
jgi:hypothetical protein